MNPLRSSRAPVIVGAAMFAALAVTPGGWEGWFTGAAYSTVTASLLVLTGVVVASLAVVTPQRQVPWAPVWTIAAMLAVRLVLGINAEPLGWRGEYTMLTPDPPKAGAFVWRLGVHPFRVDRDLVFDDRTFDLQFLNDFTRYNRRAYAPPRAASQALRVVWTGWFETAVDAPLSVHAQARGTLDVRLDTVAWFTTGLAPPAVTPQVTMSAGRHRLDLIYDKPAGTVPAVFAHALLAGRPVVMSPWPRATSPGAWPLGPIGDACLWLGFMAWLWQAWIAFRGARVRQGASQAGAAVTIAAMSVLAVWAVARADAAAGLTQELRPGDDHLAYEGLARNILEEGWLMPQGRRPGEGQPFFFYPLYSYALAGAHLVLSDSYAAVVLLNAAATAALPVLLWMLGWRALPAGVQAVGQILLVGFVLRHNGRYVDSPLTDNLFIPLILATLVLAVRAVRTSRPTDAFITGCALAACATTRPSAFLLMVPLALVLAYTRPASRAWQRLWPAGALATGYAVSLAPVVLRNWIMAGQAVAMVTLSHAIPISLIPPEVPRPDYVAGAVLFSWSSSLDLAWRIIEADPWGTAWLEARKVLFTLGATGLGPPGSLPIWEFLVLCAAGVTAFALRRVPWRTTVVLVVFLFSHLAATTIAYPWTYGYKTILPVQLVFLFAALHLLAPAPRRGMDA